MHLAHPHKQDKTGSESDDSAYDTPPVYIGLPAQILSKMGPMTWSHTRAHQFSQSIWAAWTKAIQYVQHK